MQNNTAMISDSEFAYGNIIIPHSVLNKYIIIDMLKGSFSSSKIKTLKFTEDSMILSIPNYAFSDSSIRELNLPASLQKLEDGWCSHTYNLTKITVSSDNKYFKIYQKNILVGKSEVKEQVFDILYFACRNIKTITIPSTIKRINSYSFESCSKLESIQFQQESELIIIDKYAFSQSSLISITLPKSLTIIDENAFLECRNLKSIRFENESKLYLLTFQSFSFSSITSIYIPKNIEEIGERAFSSCSYLSSVNFSKESRLKKIGPNAFSNTNLESIIIPKSVKTISHSAFDDIQNLKSIEFENGSKLCSIGSFAFCNSSITTISIPNKVLSIDSGVFNNCNKLLNINFSKEIQLSRIKFQSFFQSNIKSIVIPKSVSVICSCAFSFCENLKKVEFEDESKLRVIGESAFENTPISKISIPDKVNTIENSAFCNCTKLKYIGISEKSELTKLGYHIFYDSHIKEIYIPSNVKKLAKDWFSCMPKLKKIKISPNNKEFISIDEKIIIKKSPVNKTDYDFLFFANRDVEKVVIPSTIKIIGPFAFENCKKIKRVEFEKNSELISINCNAFEYSSLQEIEIPSKVKTIHEFAFSNCKCLKSVKFSIDSQLKYIKNSAFLRTAIESIIIPKHVLTIGPYAFSCCNNLTSIKFENESELCSIGISAFRESSITKISIPDNVDSILDETFYECKKLKSVYFSDQSQLKKIIYGAFINSGIEEIFIPRFVDKLEDEFLHVLKLKKIKTLNNSNFINIGDKILIGKSDTNENDEYSCIYFISKEVKVSIVPSTINSTMSNGIPNFVKINFIKIDENLKFKMFPFWLPFPKEKYQLIFENETIDRIYSKFTFKYYIFDERNDMFTNQNIYFNLFFYLVNFKLIIIYQINSHNGKINCIFCVENECLIIEQANISSINNLIHKLEEYEISFVNVSDNSNILLMQNDTAKEEISNFCIYFQRQIKKNYFVKYTINPIVGYLILRFYYPSHYFIDKSFFIFNQEENSSEFSVKQKVERILYDVLEKKRQTNGFNK